MEFSRVVVTSIKDANGNTITSADIGSIVHDTVHVSGSQGVPTGTVTFHRYANQTCTGTATDEGPITLDASGNDSSSTQVWTRATDCFTVTYNDYATYNGNITSAIE